MESNQILPMATWIAACAAGSFLLSAISVPVSRTGFTRWLKAHWPKVVMGLVLLSTAFFFLLMFVLSRTEI